MTKLYGLIGYRLGHSFSQKYFAAKFKTENITNCSYQNFELDDVQELIKLIKNTPELIGLNVTIPYKEAVIPLLTKLDSSASKVGAVNVIKITKDEWVGYNSDYYGFRLSLERLVTPTIEKALILGTGGASKAVKSVLTDLNIDFHEVSRYPSINQLSYEQLHVDPSWLNDCKLIINTTPLGMYPKTDAAPDIPYHLLQPDHFLFDLVYNPVVTEFMKKGEKSGVKTKNGLEMLELQAEKSWEIWNHEV